MKEEREREREKRKKKQRKKVGGKTNQKKRRARLTRPKRSPSHADGVVMFVC